MITRYFNEGNFYLTIYIIRVQAENKKNTQGTFLNQFDPRIDLAPFFLPPGIVFTYLIGLLSGPLWPPLANHPVWTVSTCTSIKHFPSGIFSPFSHPR